MLGDILMDVRLRRELILKGFDYDGALERMMDDEELLGELIFDLPDDENFEQFNANYESGDYKEAFKNIHAIKGVMKNLGLIDAVPHLTGLSDLYKAERYDDAEQLVKSFHNEYSELMELINKYREIAQ